MLGGKASVAQNIKQCWRNSPLAEEQARYRLLELVCDDPIPPLTVQFSHVSDLYVRGRCITDANADGLLATFPNLKRLRINATGDEFSNVPMTLSTLPALKDLNLYAVAPYAADMPARLNRLTTLEALSVSCVNCADWKCSRLRWWNGLPECSSFPIWSD
ncbi:hypothetical protein D3C86_1650390 [compost metagenome]